MKKIAILTLATLLSGCSMLTQNHIAGTYKGTLPCADCEKIDAELILNQDGTYEYNTLYFKRGEQFPFTEKGKFSRNPQNDLTIRLENSADLTLKVTPEYAEFCDKYGNSVKGKEYKLKKIN